MKQGVAIGLVLALAMLLTGGWMLSRQTTRQVVWAQTLESSTESCQVIYTEEQLRAVGSSRDALAGNYVLGADIVLTGTWEPIGTRLSPFTGSFDGNGHVIYGLTISGGGADTGMFGFARNAQITRVALEEATIKGNCFLPIVARGRNTTVTACSINAGRKTEAFPSTAYQEAILLRGERSLPAENLYRV